MPRATDIGFSKPFMKQDAVLWLPDGGKDAAGNPSYHDPEEIKCRWDSIESIVVTAEGEERVSSSQILVDRDAPRHSLLLLGRLQDVLNPEEPRKNDGVQEVLRFDKHPDLGGQKFERIAYA